MTVSGTTGRSGTSALALLRCCHPVPSAAVTMLAAGLAVLADLPTGRVVLVALAVLAGQLTIGWGNDYLDAERDRASARTDKPAATGEVAPTTVGRAAAVAAVATVVLCLLLGRTAGIVALFSVACGWAYNAWLKSSVLSWLPFALAFGLLPAVATLSTAPPRWPPAWAMAAAGLIGVAAHLANVLPDLRDDAATGVSGLAHRLGARATALAGALALMAASLVILLGPPGSPGAWRWTGFAVAAAIGGTAAVTAVRDPGSRRYFLGIVVVALLDLVFFAASGTRL